MILFHCEARNYDFQKIRGFDGDTKAARERYDTQRLLAKENGVPNLSFQCCVQWQRCGSIQHPILIVLDERSHEEPIETARAQCWDQ